MRSDIKVGRLSLTLAALVVGALYASGTSAAPRADGADEAAMRENVRQMEAGWNAKSGALFAEPFAVDADYVVINGMYIKGREAIAQAHQQIFDTIYKESTLSLSVKQVRRLRPDVAVVHVTGSNKTQRDGETRVSEAIITLVITKEKGVWKIAAFQNTEMTAPARQ